MKELGPISLIATAALTLAACSTAPERMLVVEDARQALQGVERHPLAARVAAAELAQARQSLQRAEAGLAERAEPDQIRHEGYLALRRAELAELRVQEAQTRAALEAALSERTKILELAREWQLEQADLAAALADSVEDDALAIADMQ